MRPDTPHLTALLNATEGGDREALRRVIPIIYEQLQSLAEGVASGRQATIQPTALVHEAFLKLSDDIETQWKDRDHFLAVAAKVMRQVLADRVRHRIAQKRGGGWERVTLSGIAAEDEHDIELESLDAVLRELHEVEPRHADLVELRFLAGLDIATSAQ